MLLVLDMLTDEWLFYSKGSTYFAILCIPLSLIHLVRMESKSTRWARSGPTLCCCLGYN